MVKFATLWLLVHLLGRLPARVLYAAADAAGVLGWLAVPRLRRITREHMRHALGGDASRLLVARAAIGCVRSAARYYVDFARYAWLDPARVFDLVDRVDGVDAFFEAYDEGNGLILISSHLGNPEFITQALGPYEFRTFVFTEPLHPPRLHDLVHRVRGRAGTEFMPANIHGVRQALKHLRHGQVVAILSDRDVLGTGRPFPFFGEPARLPTGAAELARRTGAPIINGWVLRTTPGRYELHLERLTLPPATGERDADLASAMAAIVAGLERGIRRDPGQWFVLAPIWEAARAGGAAPLQ